MLFFCCIICCIYAGWKTWPDQTQTNQNLNKQQTLRTNYEKNKHHLVPCFLLKLISLNMKDATYSLHIFSSKCCLITGLTEFFFPPSILSNHPSIRFSIWCIPNHPSQPSLNFYSFCNKARACSFEFMIRSFCFSHQNDLLPPCSVHNNGLGPIKDRVRTQVTEFIIPSARRY